MQNFVRFEDAGDSGEEVNNYVAFWWREMTETNSVRW
jgi:hypothetical protein